MMVSLKRIIGLLRSEPLDIFPIGADFTLDATTTANITQQAADKFDGAAYVRVPGATTAGFESAAMVVGDNEIEYEIGLKVPIELTAHIEASTGNSETLACAWFLNDDLVDATATAFSVRSVGGGLAGQVVAAGITEPVGRGDTFGVRVANLGSTTDITVGELNALAARI